MPVFQVLIIKEHVTGNVQQIDNRMAIIYDSEGRYHYYGTRNNDGKNNYNPYWGTYEYHRTKSFSLFLEVLLGMYDEVVTVETHILEIPEYDYNNLCWNYFTKNLSGRTLLTAYDKKMVSVALIENYLEMLVNV